MKKFLLLSILSIFFTNYLTFSQASAGSKARFESRYVVDMPNAGVLPKSDYAIISLIQPNGTTLFDFSYALYTNFNFGLSYSANNLINSGAIDFQKYPSLNLKFRILDETLTMPAFTIGFSNQGRGDYFKSFNRSQILSPGLFLVASKNFKWYLGYISSHFGINYSFDEGSDNKSPNLYFGIEQSLGSQFSFACEFNGNFNEANYTISKGILLNLAFRWSVSSNVTLELQLKDLLKNQTTNKNYIRAFGFEYIGRF